MEIDARKVDAHVGGRVRERREALGISQGSIARQLGLTFSQVQKYEKGANRIGAGRLFMLSQALGVPIQYFFDGLVAEPPVLVSDNPEPRWRQPRALRAWRGLSIHRGRRDPPVGARPDQVDTATAVSRVAAASRVRKLSARAQPLTIGSVSLACSCSAKRSVMPAM